MARENSKKRSGTANRGSMKGQGGQPGGREGQQVDPADFGKKTTPVRERLVRQVKEMPPEERLKRGR